MPKKKKDVPEEIPTNEAQEPALAEVLDAPPPADAKYAEMLDKYQRCLADFDNFRKRTAKEMAERRSDGIRDACEKLLPIIDNFERALASAENKEDHFYKGIEMIARQFDNVLDELGVKSIETEPGGAFDINLHYAVAHTEDENFGENAIVEVMQKGYVHKERVIRPAMVKVAN
ncbi:MAG: nucleotide exchange factor GrpE [Defluviitaleaceae bacterium]|nr:nucleotide exchange factor GrpE [Defluviitaleaceae bacterium]